MFYFRRLRKYRIPYKDRLRKLSYDNMGGGMITKLIIICVIRVTMHDKTGTWVKGSYNRRNNWQYVLQFFIQVQCKHNNLFIKYRQCRHVCCPNHGG